MNIEELKKALEEKETAIAELTKANADLVKSADESKASIESLTKRCDEMDKELKAKKPPEEMKKSDEDALAEFKKSMNAEMAAKFEEIEKQAKKAEELEKRIEMDAIAKRAEKEYPNLTGTPEQKAQLIKSFDGLSEETKKYAEELLKSADAAIAKSFVEVGKGNGAASGSADDKIAQIAKKFRDADPNLTEAAAIAKAVDTPEGRAIYQESVNEYDRAKLR